MIKIELNGKILNVTRGAYNSMYAPNGWKIVGEKKAVKEKEVIEDEAVEETAIKQEDDIDDTILNDKEYKITKPVEKKIFNDIKKETLDLIKSNNKNKRK